MQKTVLVVDDEKDIIELLKYNLEKEGYKVFSATDGVAALELARRKPDLVLLDVLMPGMDGWEVCKRLKRNPLTAQIPVIFLTAKSFEADEVIGLELGADDYITKPISMRTLLARLRATTRRTNGTASSGTEGPQVIRIEQLEINIPNYKVRVGMHEPVLTKKEFETLAYLASHPDRVVSRETLLNAVWGEDVNVLERTVDVHISKVREKLGKYSDLIETVKGVGYRFRT